MRAWANVATLAKTRNLDGGFVAKPAAGLPFLLEEGMEVAFVPPQEDAVRRSIVTSVVERDGQGAEVRFADITSIDDARKLVGCACLVRRSDIDVSVLDAAPERWEGWTVRDEEGMVLGSVSGVIENPAQMLLSVARSSKVPGEGDLLIPLVDEIVTDVDVEARVIHVELPAGLLEL